MVDLQRQMQDKKLRDEAQRIYLDPKQMATNGTLMEKINPELFNAKVGDTENFLKNDNIFDKECQQMSNIELSKHHLATNLRSQRFKD